MEEITWYGGGSSRDHLGSSGDHLGSPVGSSEVIGGLSGIIWGVIWGGIWRHLEQGWPEAALEEEVLKAIVFFCRKWRDRPFRLHGSEATCTISAACAQKLMGVNVQIADKAISQSQSHRQNPYSVNTVWGTIQNAPRQTRREPQMLHSPL